MSPLARHPDGPRTALAVLLALLGVGVATVAVLGPLVTDTLVHRTSPTTLNQVIGGDLAGLVVVAPLSLVAAWLVWRGARIGPFLALGPGPWAVYMYAQLVVGQEYLDLPGNVERFFPLLLALFVVGLAVTVLAWRRVAATELPALPRRLARTTGVVLLLLAAFLVVGLHLPTLLDAMGEDPTALEYTSSPSAFWIVKLMDLGIIVPAAVTIGVGLLRGARWARAAAHALLAAYTLLGAAVTGMAVVMLANGDPDGTVANVVVFATFTLALGWLTWRLLAPLARGSDDATPEAPTLQQGDDRVLVRGPS